MTTTPESKHPSESTSEHKIPERQPPSEEATKAITPLVLLQSGLEQAKALLSLVAKAWKPLLVVALFFFVVLFFVSYSLARHKRMVARLTEELQAAKTEIKVRDLRLQQKEAELKLVALKGDSQRHKQEQERIKKNIVQIQAKSEQAKKDLEKERSRIRETQDVDALLNEAKRLTKETF